jgi:hypothetical protein
VTYAEAPRPDEAAQTGALAGDADPTGSPTEEAAPAVVGELAAAAAALGELDGLPVADHVARYDALHGELSEALAAIDGI